MPDIFSHDNISYIANWCTILAFFGLGTYVAARAVKNTMRNRMKVKGNGNRAAQVQNGSVDQSHSTSHNESQSVIVNVYTPGVAAATVSPTASTNDPQSAHDQGGGKHA